MSFSSWWVSRLLPKSMPLLVRAVFGGRRHRSSSHRRSIFHFPFVLSCFPTHLVFISQLLVMYLTLCFPHVFVCVCLLLGSVRFRLVCSGCCVHPCCMATIIVRIFVWLLCAIFASKVRCSLISALLRLTSCTSYTHHLTISLCLPDLSVSSWSSFEK